MSVTMKKLDCCPWKNGAQVKVVEMGNVIEIQYMSNRNTKATIQMLPGGNEYIELSSGEIKKVTHHETRADQKKSLSRTFRNARALINTNVVDVKKVRWITLTYKENMIDTKRLYKDFEKFNKRFQYYCEKKDYKKPEYIVMMEPQKRGAWHAHLLYIFSDAEIAPYIPNKDLANIWGHGFVKVSKLDDIDNIGAYLTAYLGDMDMNDLQPNEVLGQTIKEVEIDQEGEKIKKYYVKGARLNYYPVNFNMIRYSRGIKQPTVEMMSQKMANKKVSAATLTYEKTVKLQDIENDFETIINTRYYNTKRKVEQE